ncbi:MAG: hypothetical protein GXP39_06165 [Chloroflexi bacterium]|nr:hypothetical protein [Chloroflexota bacterium]
MLEFQIELRGPNATSDAQTLQRMLAGTAQAQVISQTVTKGIDAMVVITVSAAMLQAVDILYRFYQDWRARQHPMPGSHPDIVIIRPDGTRVELTKADPETLKTLL